MSEERADSGSDALSARIEEAQQRLNAAAESAETAEKRATAEIRTLEADLEKEKLNTAEALESVRAELRRGTEARARGEGAGDRRRRGAARRDRGPRRGGRGAGQGGRATRDRGRGQDRRRPGRRPRGRRGLAARAGQDDPPRGGRAIGATPEFDVVVVGGGAAGLWTALRAAEEGGRVCLISRKPLSQSASYWAQGGLAAALEPGDSPARHAADTIAAGRGLCRPATVQVLVDEAPDAVRELRDRGVVFDLDEDGELALGLEGGHTRRRIVHSGGSQTGHEITSKLAAMVDAEPRVEVRERTSALALWSDGERCLGLITDSGPIASAATVLATGGAGGALAADDEPLGRDRSRAGARRRPPAPTSPTSSSASSTRPPWRCPAPATTAC